MLFWPSFALCLTCFLAVVVLAWLCAIDLKLRLLPDELTLALAVLGIVFRVMATPWAGPWYDGLAGLALGGGGLLAVRALANRIYGFETMGLGDIKLIAAGGIWLGPQGILAAICVGALAGIVHGLAALAYERAVLHRAVGFRDMTIPAGPGFCVGLVIIAIWQYGVLPLFAG